MIREMIRQQIRRVLEDKFDVPLPDVGVELSDNFLHGDYASSVAFGIAKTLNRKPQEIAEEISSELKKHTDVFLSVEPVSGFINFRLASSLLYKELGEIMTRGEEYGASDFHKGQRARVEYISANPTGPLHIGNARGGPLGETIAKSLEKIGYEVLREYYHNDSGTQVEKMGETLWYWYEKLQGKETEFPEGGYKGDYLKELGEAALETHGKEMSRDVLTQFALDSIYKENFETIKKMGIRFDSFVKESELLQSGKTMAVVEKLKELGMAKEQEGALWFAPGDEFLGDREAVLVRSSGQPTYFASDAAYHMEKFTSGYDLVVTVLGSNHHGHIPKLQAIARASGFALENFQVPLYQYVRVKRGDEVLKMSKRAGTYVTAKEVLDEVGPDAFIFFLLMSAPNTHMDFDLELAKEQSQKNPVYYIQYAHARCASILKKAEESGLKPLNLETLNFSFLKEPEELSIIKKMIQFPEVVEDTAHDFQVQRLPHYALELARIFHNFYEKHRVITESEDLTIARLNLVVAIQKILKGTLRLMGVEAPEVM